MKKKYTLFAFLISAICFAQVTPPPELQVYYTGVNFNDTGLDLFEELAIPTASRHTNFLTYTPGIWNASRITDEDPAISNNVLLIYGYNDTDGNYITDRTRNKNLNGNGVGTEWNREHTFPNSRGVPDLDDVSRDGPPYADAHNLRPSDITMNSNRGNRKFASGSGNAGTVGSNWYPGDEWKGDAARILMYMYLRYGNQCLPRYASSGITNSIDPNMINILLEWNVQDPVSVTEDSRNAYHGGNGTYAQGNRNPFIDNPFLATLIWGGAAAENRWGSQPPADTEAPTIPTALSASNPTASTVDLSWTASTDNVGVVGYDIYVDGANYASTGVNTTYTVTNLTAETTYSFRILAKDVAGNMSELSNTDTATTLVAPVFCVNESFENISGPPNNYGTKTWTGDDGINWTATDARTDQTLNGKAINIRNGSLSASGFPNGIGDLTVSTQRRFSGGSGTFNVVINGTIVGTIPYDDSIQTSTIAGINLENNINIVFNDKTSSSDRVSIDDLSWSCYTTLNTSEFSLDAIRIYPNPVTANAISIKSKTNLDFIIYDILGKKVLQGAITTTKNEINVTSLKKGVYIIKLANETGNVSKKLIRQ